MVLNLIDSTLVDPATKTPLILSLANKQITVNSGVPHVAIATSTYTVKAQLQGYNVNLDRIFDFEAIVACPPLQSVSVTTSALPLLKNGSTITKNIGSP